MSRRLTILVMFIVAIVISSGLYFSIQLNHLRNQAHYQNNAPADDANNEIETSLLSTNNPCVLYPERWCSSTPNDLLLNYRNESARLGIPVLNNEHPIGNYVNSGRLIPVEQQQWCYYVRATENTYRFLVPKARQLLLEITDAFMRRKSNTCLWEFRPCITSLLRTVSVNAPNNPNSTSQSSHLHGTTFDISYISFYDSNGNFAGLSELELNYLKETLACVVEDFRSQGRCYKTLERGTQSNCIHVVCR